MKKLLALIIVLASILTLASCLGGDPTGTPPAGDPTGECFTYSLLDNGTYSISGLTADGKAAKTLTIPLEYEGKSVTVIGAGAFSGGVVESVVIPADSNIGNIMTGAFADAGELKALYIHIMDATTIIPPADFSGTHKDFTIYVPEGSFYDTNYYWGEKDYIRDLIQFMGE